MTMVSYSFQARAQALIKQLEDTYEQIEQNNLALSTFKFLAEQEDLAVPRRLEVKNKKNLSFSSQHTL